MSAQEAKDYGLIDESYYKKILKKPGLLIY